MFVLRVQGDKRRAKDREGRMQKERRTSGKKRKESNWKERERKTVG